MNIRNNDNWPIIDLHCHMMPGIDDGSSNLEMTRAMFKMSYDQGVRSLFLTSHSFGMRRNIKKYLDTFVDLQKLCSEEFPGLTVYSGTEIDCDPAMMDYVILKLLNGTFLTLNQSKYVLAEFYDSGMGFWGMKESLVRLLNKGYIPILAHAERYSKFYDDALDNIRELKKLGCLVQINLYSVEETNDETIKNLANAFLLEKFVDFVGTDAHQIGHREPRVEKGVWAIRERYGDTYAREICCENARKLLM